MTADIASIFKAIGPAASIIFAAWIFMAFLQTRYDAAVDRYRVLVAQYREGAGAGARRDNLHDTILVYKKRCEIMNVASIIGLVSAIVLILALIIGELAIALPRLKGLALLCVGLTLAGLSLVIIATSIVVYEGFIIHRQLKAELLDVPELAKSIGEMPGKIVEDKQTREEKRARAAVAE